MVSSVGATAHPACPPCAHLQIREPSTNSLPPKLLFASLWRTHTCAVPTCVRPEVYLSTGSCIRPFSHFSLSPVVVAPYVDESKRASRIAGQAPSRCRADPNTDSSHFEAERMVGGPCLVWNLLRPPCCLDHTKGRPTAGACCVCRKARLFAWTTSSGGGRGKSSLRSSLSGQSFRRMRDAATSIPAVSGTHDNGQSTHSAPRGLRADEPLLSPPCLVQLCVVQLLVPDRFFSSNDGLDPAGVISYRTRARSKRHVSEHPSCLPGKRRPIFVLEALTLVGGRPMRSISCKPIGMKPLDCLFVCVRLFVFLFLCLFLCLFFVFVFVFFFFFLFFSFPFPFLFFLFFSFPFPFLFFLFFSFPYCQMKITRMGRSRVQSRCQSAVKQTWMTCG